MDKVDMDDSETIVSKEILHAFFDEFSKLERSYLYPKYRRQMFTRYLSTVIVGCSGGENSEEEKYEHVCNTTVNYAIQYHNEMKSKNGNVCLLGKFHGVLYIALKLCFEWKLNNTKTVACLLDQIFSCENSFERLFTGAIFGPKMCQMVLGWRCDFDSKSENESALKYFIFHSSKNRSLYTLKNGFKVKFVDVPLESYGSLTPAGVCVHTGQSDLLLFLLQHGAKTTLNPANNSCCWSLFRRIYDYHQSDIPIPDDLATCLKYLLRSVNNISDLLTTDNPDETSTDDVLTLLIGSVVPDNRAGKMPVELKHLCRTQVRQDFIQNNNIYEVTLLNIPESLKSYLNLCYD